MPKPRGSLSTYLGRQHWLVTVSRHNRNPIVIANIIISFRFCGEFKYTWQFLNRYRQGEVERRIRADQN